MISRKVVVTIAAAIAGFALFGLPALRADPAHPTAKEVNSVVDMLRFRSGMLVNPAKSISAYAAGAAQREFAAIDKQMTTASAGAPAGWRYLLGTSVFTAAGLNEARALIVFYNPLLDTAVFTVWEARKEGRRIVDIGWVPGDWVRQPNGAVEPRPLWLRGEVYRPQALVDEVVATVKAVETRFGDTKQIATWRDTLGIKGVKRVSLHEKLTGLLRVTVISFAKGTSRTEIWRALQGAAFFKGDMGKITIGVSEDIDPDNADAILWAMAYRMNPVEDVQTVAHRGMGHGPQRESDMA